MSTLKVTSGPAAGQTLELESRIVLGREGADVTIADPEMSRRHAELRPVEAGVEIEDLGSMNGTFVDGKRIEGAQAHTATFELRLGQSEMVVEIPPPPPPVETTKPQDIPQPDVTVTRPVPGEKVSDPERTAVRGVVPPIDPTVVRPTGQPGGAPPPAPGGAPAPAPGGAPPQPGGALPPLPPPPAAGQARAPAPAPVQKEGRSGPPRALLIIALVVAVAVVVAILVFLIL
jgi:hypothetical protein